MKSFNGRIPVTFHRSNSKIHAENFLCVSTNIRFLVERFVCGTNFPQKSSLLLTIQKNLNQISTNTTPSFLLPIPYFPDQYNALHEQGASPEYWLNYKKKKKKKVHKLELIKNFMFFLLQLTKHFNNSFSLKILMKHKINHSISSTTSDFNQTWYSRCTSYVQMYNS